MIMENINLQQKDLCKITLFLDLQKSKKAAKREMLDNNQSQRELSQNTELINLYKIKLNFQIVLIISNHHHGNIQKNNSKFLILKKNKQLFLKNNPPFFLIQSWTNCCFSQNKNNHIKNKISHPKYILVHKRYERQLVNNRSSSEEISPMESQ